MQAQMPLEKFYEKAAEDYLRRLPLEHFMEATPHANQRKITLESLDLVHAKRPDIQVFSELLVQYPLPRRKKPGQVCPDNMVVVHAKPLKAIGSYDLPLQPARPFLMIEYVSKSTKRKDYHDNKNKYEHDLKVHYYLIFDPETHVITLYHHDGNQFVTVEANTDGRWEIPDLELEVGLHDGWMRYWFRGQLLPLPADLQRELAAERQARLAAEQEVAKLRTELEQIKNNRQQRQ
jgi:Uma2 family endonuclease